MSLIKAKKYRKNTECSITLTIYYSYLNLSLSNLHCIFIYLSSFFAFFFFNDTATTEIYTLSLHDALPIFLGMDAGIAGVGAELDAQADRRRSEEHTSELQSRSDLVCRLLLEKKKKEE